MGLLFVSVQSKHQNFLFRYRSKTTVTNCFETNRKKRKNQKKNGKPLNFLAVGAVLELPVQICALVGQRDKRGTAPFTRRGGGRGSRPAPSSRSDRGWRGGDSPRGLAPPPGRKQLLSASLCNPLLHICIPLSYLLYVTSGDLSGAAGAQPPPPGGRSAWLALTLM